MLTHDFMPLWYFIKNWEVKRFLRETNNAITHDFMPLIFSQSFNFFLSFYKNTTPHLMIPNIGRAVWGSFPFLFGFSIYLFLHCSFAFRLCKLKWEMVYSNNVGSFLSYIYVVQEICAKKYGYFFIS